MKKIAAFLTIAAIAFPQNAIAVPVVSRDPLGNVIIGNTGITPGTLTLVDYNLFPNKKSFSTSGACNLLTIKKSSTFPINQYVSIGGVKLNISNYQTPALVGDPCINGVINPAYPWITVGSYKYVQTRPGDVLTLIVSGATGSTSVETPGKTRLLKTDSCGRLVIRSSDRWKIEHANNEGEIAYKRSEDHYWSYIPYPAVATTNTAPYICYKKTLYRPI